MSTENIEKFFRKAEQDSSLQQKIQAIPKEPKERAMAMVTELSVEEGLPFTVEELLTLSKDDLSDSELESVTGGAVPGRLPQKPRNECAKSIAGISEWFSSVFNF
jgi:predicted ribosomally synthesized peptide with nif11-like leader